MKITTISDTHGSDYWQEIIKKEQDSDLFIFLGDYFDSFNIPFEKQLSNFKKIIKFKKDNQNKVVLLYGNHDHSYYTYGEICSGFQNSIEIQCLIDDCIDDREIVLAHQECGFLFTHAGLTNNWLNHAQYEKHKSDYPDDNIADFLNDVLWFKPSLLKFREGRNFSSSGDDITQGPLWVRPNSLKQDMYPINQIVGHTVLDRLELHEGHNIILFTDTLQTSKEYIVITDEKISIK